MSPVFDHDAWERQKSGEMAAVLTLEQRQVLGLACKMLHTDLCVVRDLLDAVRVPAPEVYVYELSGTPLNGKPEAWTWRVEIEPTERGDVRVTRIEVRREP